MSLLSSSLITKRKILNEADEGSKYGLSDEVINGVPNEDETGEISAGADDAPEDVENVADPATDESPDSPSGDDPTSPDVEEPVDSTGEDDFSEGDEFTDDQLGEEDSDMSVDDITSEAENSPGLRILSSIGDKQYKLCNIRQFDMFESLIGEVDDTINNVLMDITPKTDREAQVLEIVRNNLSDMKTDLRNYMNYTFSDTYESNAIAYITFLKRFKIALDIITKIKLEIKETDTDNKK